MGFNTWLPVCHGYWNLVNSWSNGQSPTKQAFLPDVHKAAQVSNDFFGSVKTQDAVPSLWKNGKLGGVCWSPDPSCVIYIYVYVYYVCVYIIYTYIHPNICHEVWTCFGQPMKGRVMLLLCLSPGDFDWQEIVKPNMREVLEVTN